MAKQAKKAARRPAARIIKGLHEAALMTQIEVLNSRNSELVKLMQDQARTLSDMEARLSSAHMAVARANRQLESAIDISAHLRGELKGYKDRTSEVDGRPRSEPQFTLIDEEEIKKRLLEMPDERFDMVSQPLLDRMMGRTNGKTETF